jgi:Family of unknown function (DUF5990)
MGLGALGSMAGMRLEIRASDLPGRHFGPEQGADTERHNVCVGIQVRREPEQVVEADAEHVTFSAEVTVVPLEDGQDFRGPAVQGRRGERFVYLTWGDVSGEGFEMFRRAKLMLDRVDPALVADADASGRPLVADVRLTDEKGGPRCARVDPPAVTWSVGEAHESGGRSL